MKRYYSLGSNVIGYEYGSDFIKVFFRDGRHTVYKYTYTSCGKYHVENMKILADSQKGLNSYISKNNPQYSSKS